MNKLLTKIVGIALGATMAVGVGVAAVKAGDGGMQRAEAASTSTLTFTAACGGSGTADDGAVWTVASDAAESNYDNAKGIHYGTSKKAISYLTLTTSDISGTITQIVVNASGAKDTSAKLDITVGGSAFGSQQSLTASAANYTLTGSKSGEIVVSLTQTSATKALYCKSIAVTYDGGSGPTPTKLDTPEPTFNYANKTITWANIANADHYEINIDNGGYTTAPSPYNASSLALGQHTALVKAIGNGTTYSDSSAGSVSFGILEHQGTQADPYSVADARVAIDNLAAPRSDVYVDGIVSAIITPYDSGYKNVSFEITSDGKDSATKLLAFRTVGTDDYPIVDEYSVKVGDIVTLYGDLTKYNGTYEFAAGNELVYLERPAYTDTFNLSGTHTIFEQQSANATRYFMNIDDATASVKPAAVTSEANASLFLFTLVGNDTFRITDTSNTKGLYHSGDNTVKWGADGKNYEWLVTDTQVGELYGDYNFIGQTAADNQRYLCVYNNQDWRTYNSANASNRKAMIQVGTPKEVTGFSIDTTGANKNVLKGSTFDAAAAAAAGFEARLNYSDSTYDDVTASATWTLDTSVVNANATLTVTYGEYTPVEITGMNVYSVVITRLVIDSSSAKTTGYFVGDTLSTDGLVVKGYDSSDNEYSIELSQCTFSPTTLTAAGSQTITVTYTNDNSTQATGTYSVTVSTSAYVKASSINGGDRIILAYENDSTEVKKYMNGISSTSTKYGTVADYVSLPDPEKAMLLDVVAGSQDGTVAFKNSESKYLSWTSDNTLNVSDSVNANSSWTISFENGLATIINVSTVGQDEQRYLSYNTSSPRFACYKANNKNVTIWKLNGASGQADAEDWASDFIDDVVNDVCATFGPTFNDDMEAMWALYSESHALLSPEAKAYIASKNADANGDSVEKMLYEYGHIYGSYASDLTLDNFLGRIEAVAVSSSNRINPINKVNNTVAIVVVVTISLVSVSALGAYFLLRKKKEER